jgi:hypothetical protein
MYTTVPGTAIRIDVKRSQISALKLRPIAKRVSS